MQLCISNLRQAKVVLRRLSIDQNVEISRKRKAQDQPKIPEFIEYKSTDNMYFTVHKSSTVEHVSSSLQKKLEVESDHHREVTSNNTPTDEVNENHRISIESDQDLDVESDIAPNNFRQEPLKAQNGIATKLTNKLTKITNMSKNQMKPNKKSTNKKQCPSYKIVEETNLAVDAFRYGNINNVKHYFLSHFHADHYIGLKKTFNQNLYASNITGEIFSLQK